MFFWPPWAQRTRRLRFGPLVYALPLYHPLRLIEEICMLDQMSGGRLDIGFGRGASPIELAVFGQEPDQAQRIYAEGLDLVLQGLTRKTLDFAGEFFTFRDVPMELEPLQKPHPPLWYGVALHRERGAGGAPGAPYREPRPGGPHPELHRPLPGGLAGGSTGTAEALPQDRHRPLRGGGRR